MPRKPLVHHSVKSRSRLGSGNYAEGIIPRPLPRGERRVNKGQRPLVFDLRGFGGDHPPHAVFSSIIFEGFAMIRNLFFITTSALSVRCSALFSGYARYSPEGQRP